MIDFEYLSSVVVSKHWLIISAAEVGVLSRTACGVWETCLMLPHTLRILVVYCSCSSSSWQWLTSPMWLVLLEFFQTWHATILRTRYGVDVWHGENSEIVGLLLHCGMVDDTPVSWNWYSISERVRSYDWLDLSCPETALWDFVPTVILYELGVTAPVPSRKVF